MKKFYWLIALTLIILTPICALGFQNSLKPNNNSLAISSKSDTNDVIILNKEAYKARSDDAKKTVFLANKAFILAQKLKFENGMAEALRVKGVGYGYQYNQVEAYNNYSEAIRHFKLAGNRVGEGKVYNNIGNIYLDNDSEEALDNYNKALNIANETKNDGLLSSVNLNLGNLYLRETQYSKALANFKVSQQAFEKLKDTGNIVKCIQNTGVCYYYLKQYDKAEPLLLKANLLAKVNDLENSISSIDLTLSDIYIGQGNFAQAEKYIKEGASYASNAKLKHDYNYTSYQLELRRKNYQKAVLLLADIYSKDSTEYKNFISQQLTIAKNKTTLKANELLISDQKYARSIAIGTGVGVVLLLIVVGLLFMNVKRKAQTNKQLTDLNEEVSRQKDNVDRINRHLEEIIDERTKDLQIKNKKLAEHSSYLSHQIRGPIATLKGLMNLEKEGLVDQEECINMMNKCVSEIDDKIIDMSDMLHNPGRTGL